MAFNQAAYDKRRYKKNRKRILAQHHKWHKAYYPAYYKKNRKAILARTAKWVKANKERALATGKAYRKKNRARLLDSCRRWGILNAKRKVEMNRQWRKENPEHAATLVRARRVRVLGNGGSHTVAEWTALKKFYGNRCVCCGKSEHKLKRIGRNLVPDHVLPLRTKGRNDISNIQPLCHTMPGGKPGGCNNRKHTAHIDYRPTVPRQRRA
jgi:hypothetical protein